MNEIRMIPANGVNEEDLAKIKEYFAKQHPDDIRQNRYWANILTQYHVNGYNLESNYMESVHGFNSDFFKALAAKILADGNIVEVLMDPAN